MASVAISQERVRRAHRFQRPILVRTLAYYLIFVMLGAGMAALGPTLPGLAAQTAVGLSAVSTLLAARAFGRFGGTLLAGRIYDHVLGHPVVATAIFTIAVMSLVTSFLPLLWAMALVFFLIGLSEGLLDVGVNILLLWTYREKSSLPLNGLHFMYGVGSFLMPVLVAQILLWSSGTDAGYFIAPFAHLGMDTPAPVVVWVYRVLAVFLLPILLLILTQKSPALQQEKAPEDEEPAVTIPWRLVGMFALMFGLYVGAEVSYSGWVYTYAVERNLADVSSAAYLVSLFWLTVTVGRLIAILLSTRLTPRQILSGALSLAVFGSFVLIIFPSMIWVGTAIFALGMSPIFPTTLAFASRNFAVTGRMTSYFYLGANFSVTIFPWLVGQLFVPIGPEVLLYLVALAMTLDLIIFILLMRAVKSRAASVPA